MDFSHELEKVGFVLINSGVQQPIARILKRLHEFKDPMECPVDCTKETRLNQLSDIMAQTETLMPTMLCKHQRDVITKACAEAKDMCISGQARLNDQEGFISNTPVRFHNPHIRALAINVGKTVARELSSSSSTTTSSHHTLMKMLHGMHERISSFAGTGAPVNAQSFHQTCFKSIMPYKQVLLDIVGGDEHLKNFYVLSGWVNVGHGACNVYFRDYSLSKSKRDTDAGKPWTKCVHVPPGHMILFRTDGVAYYVEKLNGIPCDRQMFHFIISQVSQSGYESLTANSGEKRKELDASIPMCDFDKFTLPPVFDLGMQLPPFTDLRHFPPVHEKPIEYTIALLQKALKYTRLARNPAIIPLGPMQFLTCTFTESMAITHIPSELRHSVVFPKLCPKYLEMEKNMYETHEVSFTYHTIMFEHHKMLQAKYPKLSQGEQPVTKQPKIVLE